MSLSERATRFKNSLIIQPPAPKNEDETDIVNLVPCLIHYLYQNTMLTISTFMNDWTVFVRHPFDSFLALTIFPIATIGLLAFSVLLWLFLPKDNKQVTELTSMVMQLSSLADVLDDDRLRRNIVQGLKVMEKKKAYSFDVNVARALLMFASVVYHDHALRLKYLEPLLKDMAIDYVSVADQNIGHICGIFLTNSHDDSDHEDEREPLNIIISFRGTSPLNFNQWLVNSSFRKKDAHDFLYGACQEGMYQVLYALDAGATQETYWDIIDEIKKIAPEDPKKKYRLWVTGHSLGGGFASLFYPRVRDGGDLPPHIEVCGAYTFGQPRAANLEFRNAFHFASNNPGKNKPKLFRVQNANDPVPRLPPTGNDDINTLQLSIAASGIDFINFCHFGDPIYIHCHDYTWLPDTYPKYVVGTWKDFLEYYKDTILVGIGLPRIVDFFLGWKDVWLEFQHLLDPHYPYSQFNQFLFFLMSIPLHLFGVLNHVSRGYMRNLDTFERVAVRHGEMVNGELAHVVTGKRS